MSNETWTDWLIQCDMLQDITRFPAMDWVYTQHHLSFEFCIKPREPHSKSRGRTYLSRGYSFTLSAYRWRIHSSSHAKSNYNSRSYCGTRKRRRIESATNTFFNGPRA